MNGKNIEKMQTESFSLSKLLDEIQEHPYWKNLHHNYSRNEKFLNFSYKKPQKLEKKQDIDIKQQDEDQSDNKFLLYEENLQHLLIEKLENKEVLNHFQKDNEDFKNRQDSLMDPQKKNAMLIEKNRKQELEREKVEQLQMEFKDFQYNYEYFREQFKQKVKMVHVVGYKAIESLFPKVHINDEVLNFFNQFILDSYVEKERKDKIYLFNTYFMTNLCPHEQMEYLENNESAILNQFKNRYFGADKSMTKTKRYIKADIFQKDYLIFPLFLPEHWSLFIITFPNKLIENFYKFKEEMETENSQNCYEKPIILYFDSFGVKDEKYITILRLLIEYEFKTRKAEENPPNIPSEELEVFRVTEENMPCYQPLVPRQTNYSDCGLYMMEYIEQFLRHPQKILVDIEKEQNWNKLQWFPREFCTHKRDHILKILQILREDKLNYTRAIEYYSRERQEILNQLQDNPNQYDEIDMEKFEQFLLKEKQETNVDNICPEEKHKNLLDFYMNPNYEHNVYDS